MPKIQVAMAGVIITRDAMTILHRQVPAHEVPILNAVFGRDNVQPDEAAKPEPVELDPATEAERLQAKYGGAALEKSYGANFENAIEKACADAAVKAPKKADKA